MNIDKTAWEEEILDDLFQHEDTESIMRIPVPEVKTVDKIIWMEDEKGVYTVRSCYKKLFGIIHSGEPPFWTRMWKLRMPPRIKFFFWHVCSSSLPTFDVLLIKQVQVPSVCQLCNGEDETPYHLFVRCPLAKRCWESIDSLSSIHANSLLEWLESLFSLQSDNELCLAIAICWKLWDARNEKVWNHVVIRAQSVFTSAHNCLHEWLLANYSSASSSDIICNPVKWSKPPPGHFKANVDAALDINRKLMGFGFVLHDLEGKLIAARSVPWPGLYKPNEAEAIGVREALKWLKQLEMDSVQVETDCLQVVNGIQAPHTVSFFDLITNDIREIARVFTNISFLFVKRSANEVAHLLAREALLKSDCSDCSSVPFPFIVHTLNSDLS